jgi:hypothetical protein
VVLPEVIACACPNFYRVFLTRVVVQNVGNVEPLGARMRNRVSRPFSDLGFPPFFRVFSDMTLPVGLKDKIIGCDRVV